MKKIISMVLSFILILGCSTTAFAAETHNYDTENLPHDGADYFETEIKADEENEERISDFVTVYGYQYTKGSLKSGAWRNGTSGGSSTSSAKLSLNYTQDTSYNISFKASVSGGYTNGGMSLDTYLNIVHALESSPMVLMSQQHPEKHIERFAFMMNRCDEREIEFALHMIEQILRGQEDYLSE